MKTSAPLASAVTAFEAELDSVHRMLRRAGASEVDVEDLVHEVFLVMRRRWSDYDTNRPLRPWLLGIAFRVAQDHRRRFWREVPLGFVDAEDPTAPADDRLAAERARRFVHGALRRLPEKQRMVLMLHDLDGIAMQEISRSLEVPLTTLYSRLVKARRSFAKAVRQLETVRTARAAPGALLELERDSDPATAELRARLMGRVRAIVAMPDPPRIPWSWGRLVVAGAAAAALCLVLTYRSAPRWRPAGSALAASTGPLAEGLVGYWRFDEGPGSEVARDLSGNGTDCILRAPDPGAHWLEGRFGGAVQVHGQGWLECPSPHFGQSPDLTLAAWVRRPQSQRGMRALVSRQLGQAQRDHFFFGFVDDRLSVSSHVWHGPVQHPLPLHPERWVHLAAVHRDGVVRLFVDGAQVGESRSYPGRTVDTATPLMIGAAVNGPDQRLVSQRFVGAIDELLVYRRALANDEIAALARGARPPARAQ